MKKVLQSATALAAAMISLPAVAHATEGWYGRLDAGYSFDGELEVSRAPAAAVTLNGGHETEEDWSQFIGLGYAFPQGVRLEGEFGHRYNALADSTQIARGGAHAWSGMVNAFYDFNRSGTVQPYIGAGIGAARVVADAVTPGSTQTLRGHSTAFAWQGLAGVAFALSERLSLDIGYRYFRTNGLEFIGSSTVPLSAVNTYDADYTDQAATVGLRWQFAAAAPAAPPPTPAPPPPEAAPAPVQVCPTQEFKVYFDWDSVSLNKSETQAVLANAIQRAKECNVSTVKVVGYTDTSGSPSYNIGLSQRRASVVAEALTAGGIPAAVISTEGVGETVLEKPTADGVRDPLNRRSIVTISFQ